MITFKTELHILIYKEIAHQEDNVKNYNSFHGASKCENGKAICQFRYFRGGDLIDLDLIRSPLLPRAINCRK
jgi:hypothetical protein